MTELTRAQILQTIESARAKGDKPELVGVDLKEMELRRMDLHGVNFIEANLSEANLSRATFLTIHKWYEGGATRVKNCG